MNLTPEQIAAAKAIGCAFFPASELQVQRLTMQQRVFRVDGKPFLVTRDGSYYETIGTLRALIAAAAPVQADAPSAAVSEVAPASPPTMPEPAPQASPPVPEPPVAESAAPKSAEIAAAPRKRGRPRKVAAAPLLERLAETLPEPPPEPEATEAPTEAPPAAAPSELAENTRGSRLARRRAGRLAPPKWQTAGPARRGRLKRF